MRKLLNSEDLLAAKLRLALPLHRTPDRGINCEITHVLRRAVAREYKVFLVGGFLRNLAFGREVSRDVDFTVLGSSAKELRRTYADLVFAQTSFGGLRLKVNGAAKKVPTFDVWRVEDTWALRHHAGSITIHNFLATPFLNVDAIAAEWMQEEKRWTVYGNAFYEGAKSRTLDINYLPNPNPLLCAIRSVVLGKRHGLSFSARLAFFISTQIAGATASELLAAQLRHFGKQVASETFLRHFGIRLSHQLSSSPEEKCILRELS